MSTTKPIRKREDIEALKNYFLYTKHNMRNYIMVCLGINSALRISDLLSLTWGDVYDFAKGCFREHIDIVERKTGKQRESALNKSATKALESYKNSLPEITEKTLLFPGRSGKKPLSRSQAYRILHSAGKELHFETGLSCHSLRKTFGYHAWKMGVQPAMLMQVFNHSSYQVTRRYLGIEQDDIDQVFLMINI